MNNEPSCRIQHHEFETCGIVFRPMTLHTAGDKIDGHTHYYDHPMIVIEGEADVVGRYPDGSLAIEDHVKAGEVFAIPKNIRHEITATVVPYRHFCAFPSRLPSGKIAGENTHWPGSST